MPEHTHHRLTPHLLAMLIIAAIVTIVFLASAPSVGERLASETQVDIATR
jgi:hypothetical protein